MSNIRPEENGDFTVLNGSGEPVVRVESYERATKIMEGARTRAAIAQICGQGSGGRLAGTWYVHGSKRP